MSYFKVPLGLYQEGQNIFLKIDRFSLCIPLLPYGWGINKKVWIKDYEARRRKRGTVMSGR